MSTEKIYQTLPVKLSAKELEERAHTLATKIAEEIVTEAEAKRVAKEYKTRLEEISQQITDLSVVVFHKREDREIECELQPDYKRGVMEAVRLDTEEVVESRPLLPAEMQAELFAERTH